MRIDNTDRPALPNAMPFHEFEFNAVADSISDMLNIAAANPTPAIFYSLSLHTENMLMVLDEMREENSSLTLSPRAKETLLSLINRIPASYDPG